MYNKLYDEIKFITEDNVQVDIKLPGRVNLIKGNSATGKTFFVDLIQKILDVRSDYILNKYNLRDNIKIFKDTRDNLSLNKITNTLIIIDEADNIVTPKIVKHINTDVYNGNQYLIMTRAITGLRASQGCIGEFIRDKNKLYTKYRRQK